MSDIAWMDAVGNATQRAEALLARMTLAQKVHLLHGHVPLAYRVPGEPELGIPDLKMTDGPAGVNLTLGDRPAPATAMPMPIAVAATWNPSAAALQGALIARELHSHGYNVLLAPNVDVIRQPWWGRAAEQFGEDPYLIGQMGVAFIRAAQTQPVIACAKHFVAYQQELNRLAGADAVVDERALREVYLRPFDAAVQLGGVGSVMTSFNRINGIASCEHAQLLTDVLKSEFGFRGWVMSDYGSTTSTVGAASAGSDQEMPGESGGVGYGDAGSSLFGGPLLEAVRTGRVSESTVDGMAFRILRQMFARGLFEPDESDPGFPETEHADVAYRIATEAVTLLKNEAGALPLNAPDVRSIAVIGADADHRAAAGGASYVPTPTHVTTLLSGLRERAARDGIRVCYAPGDDPVGPTSMLPGPAAMPSFVLAPPDAQAGEKGLKAEYWMNTAFRGQPSLVRLDPQVNVHLGFMSQTFRAAAVPAPPGASGDDISARWTGTFTPPGAGEYRLTLTSLGSAWLWLDDRLLIDAGAPHMTRVDESAPLQFEAGRSHALRIEYASTAHANSMEIGDVQLGWIHPSNVCSPGIQAAAVLAAESDVAIVCARTFESEQRDRASLTLPNEQDLLISAVAAANPRTVVVLCSGGPVTMPWLDQVQAVVQAYYAGQEQGAAVAAILFGDVDPSGRLPITFPQDEAQVPVTAPRRLPDPLATFMSEGFFVGYRAYDRHGLVPRFPFGHGLSYTTFVYRDLALSHKIFAQDTGLTVQVSVTNTGERAGLEVVQLYLHDVEASVARPVKELRRFAKVALAPGATTTIAWSLTLSDLAYWSETQRTWLAEAGAYEIWVGRSAGDIRLRDVVHLEESIDLSQVPLN